MLSQKLALLIGLWFSFSCRAEFKPLVQFGDNPGELTASYFAPKTSSPALSLVVLLHGCVQKGESLAQQSGFKALAQAHNFMLLLPQQSTDNNVKGCFNWFSASDTTKNSGESLSIKNMILTMKKRYPLQDVYLAGLSAGGAMATSMLVNYPTLFRGGGVIAGIPYPCADSLIKAIACMRNGPSFSVNELVQSANSHNSKTTTWPNLLVITGNNDNVVNPKNSIYIANQWANLKKLSINSDQSKVNGYQISQWVGIAKTVAVELLQIDNIDHGMSVNPNIEMGGKEAPFLLKAPISSAIALVNFWGLSKNHSIIQ